MTEQEREELIVKIERDALREENARLREAVGLMTTMAPFMELDVNDPVGTAKTVWAEQEKLFQENARLRAALKPFVPKTQVIDAAIPDTRPIDVMVRAGELRAAAAAIREGEMADVIEKLKEYAQYAETKSERDTFEVAFQEIARLREENARLREALKPFILETRPENNVYGYEIVFVKPEQLSAARAAIREGGVE